MLIKRGTDIGYAEHGRVHVVLSQSIKDGGEGCGVLLAISSHVVIAWKITMFPDACHPY